MHEDQQDRTLTEPAAVNLMDSKSTAEMARREQMDPDKYAVALSLHIRDDGMSLDVHRERLAALAQVGAGLAGGQASAEELARHFVVLNALFDRFAYASAKLVDQEKPLRDAAAAEKLLMCAIKAHRAAVSVLGALKAIRDERRPDNDSAHGTGTCIVEANHTDANNQTDGSIGP